MRNNNLLSLFSNMNRSNPIDYSMYSSIKSGSYGKLLKAHYAELNADKKTNSNDKTTQIKSNKDKNVSSESTKLATEAKELKDSVVKLADKDLWKSGDEARDKIISAVKDFADDYNKVISQVSKVKSADAAKSNKWMQSLTGVMSNTLGRAGISVGLDGKLSVDEDKMKKADLNTIKSLFSGSHSYGDEIFNDATSIANAALRTNSIYGADAKLQSPVSSFFDQGF